MRWRIQGPPRTSPAFRTPSRRQPVTKASGRDAPRQAFRRQHLAAPRFACSDACAPHKPAHRGTAAQDLRRTPRPGRYQGTERLDCPRIHQAGVFSSSSPPIGSVLPGPLLQTWVTRTWRAWGARVECSDQPGLVLGTHDEPPHPDPERTQPHPLRPIQRDLDQARSGAIDKSGASPVVDSAENVETQRTTQFAQAPVQWPGRCNGLARDRGLKGPPHANVDC